MAAVALLGASVQSALAQSRQSPRLSNGYYIDNCLNWGTNCGRPAADRYCQMNGFAGGASNFTTANLRPTWVIGDNRACNETYCIGFTSIDCVRSGGQVPGGAPKLSNGYAVDTCLNWGTNCGKPAADQYCRMNGYAGGAASFTTGNMRPTWIIGDNRACNETYCTGFTSITCVPNGGQVPGTAPKLSNGYAVDTCLNWGTNCGKPAADRYCRMNGYAGGAASFTTGNMRPTWVIGDNRACNETYCTGFTSINCVPNSPGGGGGTGRPGAWVYRDRIVLSSGDRPEWKAKTLYEQVELQGGTIEVNVVGDNYDVCPGGVERIRFQWRIDRDISQVMPGSSFGWSGTAQLITQSNGCTGGLAYRTYFRVVGSMGMTIPLPRDFPRFDGDRFQSEGNPRATADRNDPNRNAANGVIKVSSLVPPYPDRQTAFLAVVFAVPGETRWYIFRYDAPK